MRVSSSPVMPEMMRKVAMCGPVLPCLTSSSLDQPGQTSVDWQTGEAAPVPDLVEQVCEGEACGWCLAMPRPSQLQLCSACSSVAYCGTICQGESWPSHRRVCKKMKGVAWTQKMELVTSMMQLARSRKEGRSKVKSTDCKLDKVKNPNIPEDYTKSTRTVQFSSQPQFEPSQTETVPAGPSTAAVRPKSILRRGMVKLQTVLYSPPMKTLEQHLISVRDGSQEERFKQLKKGGGGSSIKKQTSEKLKLKLKEIGQVKLNLSQKLEEISSPTFTTQDIMTSPSPVNSKTTTTPISSPTLVEAVKTFSSTRQSSGCRVLSRCHQSTPFPHQVDLDSDQELSLTPSEVEKEGALTVSVTRKIDFDEDNDDDVEIGNVSSPERQKFEEPEETPEIMNSSLEDMFDSQESGKKVDEDLPAAKSSQDDAEQDDLLVIEQDSGGTGHAGVNTETEDNVSSQDSDVMAEQMTGERVVVMIPESSSDSSLAMFSPVQLDSQDQLMSMFSDPEQEEVLDEQGSQEEDILTEIEDSVLE